MDIKNILNSDYLDILFFGKNKKYGGYELRKKYNKRMLTAAIIAIGGIGLIFASTLIDWEKAPEEEELIVVDKVVTMTEPPPLKPNEPPPPPPPSAPPPQKPQVKFTPPVIAPNKDVVKEDKIEKPDLTKNETVGPKTVEGDQSEDALDPSLANNLGPGRPGSNAPSAPREVEPPKKQEPLRNIQQKAKFKGGDFKKYLADNLNYPQVAMAQGIEGTVVVEFVVDEFGKIHNPKVIKGIGGGCDEEAIRVIKKSSGQWEPGVHNGEKRSSYFTQTVTFRLQ